MRVVLLGVAGGVDLDPTAGSRPISYLIKLNLNYYQRPTGRFLVLCSGVQNQKLVQYSISSDIITV